MTRTPPMAHDPTPDADDPDRPPPQFWSAGRDQRPWWNRDLGRSPLVPILVGLGGSAAAVIAALVAFTPRAAPPTAGPPPAPPPAGVVGGPKPGPVRPGGACTISNLRLANGLFSGFGGQPSLTFDYAFVGGRDPLPLVAVVTVPGRRPVNATVAGLFEDRGTVSLAPLDAFAEFPRGTTVYLASQIDTDADGTPKRLSNVLTLE